LGRHPGYDFRGYIKGFSGLAGLLPKVPLAGPATGKAWTSHLGKIVASEPALRVLTVHAYQLGCRQDPTLPAYPTVPRLLRPGVWRAHMRLLKPYVALAHMHRVTFRIAEMNSVSCGGKRGVSDTFASALWALEALFDAERAGIDGVNIHTYDGTANRLFTFRQQQGHWLGSVYPEYYGLLMFAQASPPGSRLLSITAPGSGALQAWATLASDGRIRVVLINDSLARVRSVLVRAPGSANPAVLERLQAHSAYALGGVSLAGQSFGPQTATGALTGPARSGSVAPAAGGYHVTIPPASVAMLTIAGGWRKRLS
jgi:hypothetical protein